MPPNIENRVTRALSGGPMSRKALTTRVQIWPVARLAVVLDAMAQAGQISIAQVRRATGPTATVYELTGEVKP